MNETQAKKLLDEYIWRFAFIYSTATQEGLKLRTCDKECFKVIQKHKSAKAFFDQCLQTLESNENKKGKSK